MGMFDELRCKYPLPVPGANDLLFQTKDTPAQYLDLYELREDGTLWYEAYDIEDQSLAGKWKRENPGEAMPKELDSILGSFVGCMAKVNKRWEPVAIGTQEIRFYTHLPGKDDEHGWIEFSAYFVNGKLNQLNLVRHELPKTL